MSRLSLIVGAFCALFGALVGWMFGYQAGRMDKAAPHDHPDRVDGDESNNHDGGA